MRKLECGVRNRQNSALEGSAFRMIRGSANGRLPDFESGDGGSNPSPRAELKLNKKNELGEPREVGHV